MFRSVLVAVRGDPTSSRYAVEAALGAGSALAAHGDEDAAEVVDLARGWLAGSGHTLPPAIRRVVDALPPEVEAGVVTTLSDPRDWLLSILERYPED
jgi:hypothetical protein